jgi:GNAT superfamily N-acetyltransferase
VPSPTNHDRATPVELSEVDEQRFGVRTAIARHVTVSDVDAILEFCVAHDVRLLIARSPATDLAAAQALESAGGRIMDTLVYYRRRLDTPLPNDVGAINVRPVRRESEASTVAAVAAEAFGGYYGHYHADPRLPGSECDAAYVSWAERSVREPDVAAEVLVGELDGAIVGFATLRLNSPEEAEGVLFAVAVAAQGRGLYRSFMVRGIEWAAAAGAETMVVSTQVTNIAVQKVWVRVGFEPAYSSYTFHHWFG